MSSCDHVCKFGAGISHFIFSDHQDKLCHEEEKIKGNLLLLKNEKKKKFNKLTHEDILYWFAWFALRH